MPITKITRDEILDIAEKIFRERGYHNTSMKDIADRCGLFKGSLYHHFMSKETMMQAVLERNRENVAETIFAVAYREDIPPEKRLETIAEIYAEKIEKQTGGCIMGNTALETGYMDDFKPILIKFFDDWQAAFTNIFAYKMSGELAGIKAKSAIQMIEGAFMLYKIAPNPQIITDTKNSVIALMEM